MAEIKLAQFQLTFHLQTHFHGIDIPDIGSIVSLITSSKVGVDIPLMQP